MQPSTAAPTTSAQALSGLNSLQSSSQSPAAILAQQQQQMGVTGAQQTVQGLRGAINNTTTLLGQVAPSVLGRTGSSLVTNAQADKQITNGQAPLNTNLSNETTGYNQANTDLTNLENQAQTSASGIYQGQQDKLSYAQNIYNSLYTQEQNAQAETDRQAAAAEQIRQFNAQQTAANQQFNYGVSQDKATQTANQQAATAKALADNKAKALTDVKSVLGKSNLAAYKNAVSQSAANGNELDKIKLELLQQLAPQLFVNTSGVNPKQTYAPVKAGGAAGFYGGQF